MTRKQFNAFDCFETDEEALAFLSECYNDDDSHLFIRALSQLVAKKGVVTVSRLAGLNCESLHEMANGKTEPTWETIHKILRALKINVNFSYT